MSHFKELINEVKDPVKSNVEFLLDHKINPSIMYGRIPLYDENSDSLILLVRPSKSSKYFSQKDDEEKVIFPDDKVIIQAVSEERMEDGNYYIREYGDPEEITVDEFMDIYNAPENEETRTDIEDFDIESDYERNNAKSEFFRKRKELLDKKEKEYTDWLNEYGDYFNDIQDKATLKKLYKAFKDGISVNDLLKSPMVWEAKNKAVLEIISDVTANMPKEKAKPILDAYKRKRIDWFREGLEGKKLLLTVAKWLRSGMDESVLDEYKFIQNNKPIPMKDPKEVKDTLAKLNIDPKFYTVPITIEPLYNKEKYRSAKDDPNAERVQKLVIIGFPDKDKLDDNDLVTVKDVAYGNGGDTFNMRIGDLRKETKEPINVSAELDTIEFRTRAKQQSVSLNKGQGKYVKIPDNVIEQMLEVVQDLDEFVYSDYGHINLLDYYKRDPFSKVIQMALNMYNSKGQKAFKIRAFNNNDLGKKEYRGWIPYEDVPQKNHPMGTTDVFKKTMRS